MTIEEFFNQNESGYFTLKNIFPMPLSVYYRHQLLLIYDQISAKVQLVLNGSHSGSNSILLMVNQKKQVMEMLELQNEIIEMTHLSWGSGDN